MALLWSVVRAVVSWMLGRLPRLLLAVARRRFESQQITVTELPATSPSSPEPEPGGSPEPAAPAGTPPLASESASEPPPPPIDDIRERLTEAVLAESAAAEGMGEFHGNNRGPDVEKFLQSVDPKIKPGSQYSWCAASVYYVLVRAYRALGRAVPFKGSFGAKALFKLAKLAGGERLTRPEPGCLVLWHRGPKGAATGHIGICLDVAENGVGFRCREGNRGSYPSRYGKFPHKVGEENLLAFLRLPL